MAASSGFACRIVSHVLCVATPGLADGVELVWKGLNGSRVDTAVADSLAVGSGASKHEVCKNLAVVGCVRRGCLTTDHGGVIIQADAPGTEKLIEKKAKRPGGLGEGGAFEFGPEISRQ